MATIGQQLTVPESGWRRYDDSDSSFIYDSNLTAYYNSTNLNYYLNSVHYNWSVTNSSIKFKFKGTKLRLILANGAISNTMIYGNNKIIIDGIEEDIYKLNYGEYFILGYEKTGLSDIAHDVEIKIINSVFGFDAIDIDEDGCLLHPYLTEKFKLEDMEIGDVIRCDYVASSNQYGQFSNLGKISSRDMIPVTSSTTPNGTFYWIMVGYDHMGRKKLIADRNIQNGISWDTLSNNYAIYSKPLFIEKRIPLSASNIEVFTEDRYQTTLPEHMLDDNTTTFFDIPATTNPTYHHWIKIKLDKEIDLSSIDIGAFFDVHAGVKDFEIKVATIDSNDFSTYQTIFFATHQNNSNIINYKINKRNRSKYILLNILSSYRPSTWTRNTAIHTLNIYENVSPNYNLELGLLSGGYSNLNTNNDWDQIIVNSDLNGKITPGDNNIWNWKGQWTEVTTSHRTAANRIVRGYSSVSGFSNIASDTVVVSNTGYRPVLYVRVENPTIEDIQITDTNLWITDTHDVSIYAKIRNVYDSNTRYCIYVNGNEVIPMSDPIGPNFDINVTIPRSSFNKPINKVMLYVINDMDYVNTFVYYVIQEDINTNPIKREFEFEKMYNLNNQFIIDYYGLKLNEGLKRGILVTDHRSRISTIGKSNIKKVFINSSLDVEDIVTDSKDMNIINTLPEGIVSSYKIKPSDYLNKLTGIILR